MKQTAPLTISRGGDAGTYQAFPDLCRLRNGNLAAVFYAGYAHVSLPREPDWPNGGRICLVVSTDEGHTWSAPRAIYDDAEDNRDPHIAEMPDGSLRVTFFSLRPDQSAPSHRAGTGVHLIASRDGGKTWESTPRTLTNPEDRWFCSAPIRVLPSGTWLLGVYKYAPGEIYGGVLRSPDNGRTWSAPIPIGKDQEIPLDAETDVIALKDGTIFAACAAGSRAKVCTSRQAAMTAERGRLFARPGSMANLRICIV